MNFHRARMSSSMLPSSPTAVADITGEENCFALIDPPLSLKSSRSWGRIKASNKAKRTENPIRKIVDPIVANIQSGKERGDGKEYISLALGDPTAGGNLPSCPVAAEAILQVCMTAQPAAGYVNACGENKARQAVAKAHKADPDSVIIANGCSGALELALTALLDPGTLLLVPRPGFPLYQVICESHGAQVIHYRLLPERDWEIDTDHIRELMIHYGDRIKGIVINNPSNPTGAVYTKEHLIEIVNLCDECRLPIIADEVYGDLVFSGHSFHPLASIAQELGGEVPVITSSGIGKQYLLPGWRLGWLVFQDNVHGTLKEVESGAKRLAQIILGASHLAQKAVPALLSPEDDTVFHWKSELRKLLEIQASSLCENLADIDSLTVLRPGGAMYTMVQIHFDKLDETIRNDIDFSERLLKEENVFILPGTCFGVENSCRLVFCSSTDILKEASDRIRQFCERHEVV